MPEPRPPRTSRPLFSRPNSLRAPTAHEQAGLDARVRVRAPFLTRRPAATAAEPMALVDAATGRVVARSANGFVGDVPTRLRAEAVSSARVPDGMDADLLTVQGGELVPLGAAAAAPVLAAKLTRARQLKLLEVSRLEAERVRAIRMVHPVARGASRDSAAQDLIAAAQAHAEELRTAIGAATTMAELAAIAIEP